MREELDLKDRSIGDDVSLDILHKAYHAGLFGLNERTINALFAWQDKFPDEKVFFHHFLTASKLEIFRLRGVNLSLLREILSFRKSLNKAIHYALEEDVSDITERPSFIDDPEDPVVQDVPAMPEDDLLNFVEPEEDADALFSDDAMHQVTMSAPSGISDADYERLSLMQETLGHFPFFAAIDAYIEGLEDPGRTIVKEGIRVYDEVEITDIESLMVRLSLTEDAVRKRRYVMLQKLESFFHLLHDASYITKNPYIFQMNHVEREINTSEGTNFRLPFVYWALGTAFPELTLLGDTTKYFTAISNTHQALFLAPTALFDIFDFQGFIDTINDQLKVRRINEESISLNGLMSEHFKVRYYEEELPEIERTCRTFLYINFPVDVDYGNIIFKANKEKNNILVVEEIVRAASHPMTLSEILDEVLYQYPERDLDEERIRGAIYRSGNIIPTMPPGTFAWDDGQQEVGRPGTVCTYLDMYLQSLPDKIATSASATEYVQQFISNTTEEKILNRLYSEAGKEFALYYNNGIRYIGYASGDYPDDFFSFPSDYRIALSYSTFFPQFIEFVEAYHRFPFSSGVEDKEKKLRNFWIRTELDYDRGLLGERTARYFKKVLDEYGRYKVDKPEYLWLVQYSNFAHKIGLELSEEEAFLLRFEPDREHSSWLNHILSDYKYRIERIPDWKKKIIEKIIHHLQSTDTPYSELLNKLKLNV